MKKAWTLGLLVLMGCGSQGEPGPTGPQGTTGSGLTVSSLFTCSKTASGYLFAYQGVKYSTGDAWVECSAAGNSFQVGTSQFYKSSQAGATSYGCVFVMDSDGTSSSGYWNFSATTAKKAVYNDTGSVNDQFTVTFASTDCTTL